jgi:hypothetical protein
MALESGEVDLAAGYFENFDGSFRQQLLRSRLFLAHRTLYQPTGGGRGFQEHAVDQAFAVADGRAVPGSSNRDARSGSGGQPRRSG